MVRNFCFIITVLITLLLCNGCTDEYKTYIVSKRDVELRHSGIITEHPRFSIEYPSSFGFSGINALADVVWYSENFTEARFARNESSLSLSAQSTLYVDVFKESPGVYDSVPLATLDSLLSHLPAQNIKEETKRVADIDAKYYQWDLPPYDDDKAYYKDLYYFVVFEYDGFTWAITMLTHKAIAEQTEAEFNHVVQSFKFIN